MSDKPKKTKKTKKVKGSKVVSDGDTSPHSDGATGMLIDLSPEELSNSSKTTVSVKACPIEQVTIFNDRAEVTRKLSAQLKRGVNEVSVSGLSSKVDPNSVRVAGGKGSAIILEVSYSSRWQPKTRNDGTELSKMKLQLEGFDEKIQRLEEEQRRIEKENAWLSRWAAATLSKSRDKDAKEPDLLSPKVLEQAENFMAFYQKNLASIDERRAVLARSLKELEEQREILRKSTDAAATGDTEQVHEVVILVHAEKDTNLEVMLSYIVMDAKWQACYDVRVDSGKTALGLTYYGIITNDSLDDWVDAQLALSTATPSVGGAPPTLTTKHVDIRVPVYATDRSADYGNVMMSQSRVADFEEKKKEKKDKSEDSAGGGRGPRSQPLKVMTTSVQESAICASFSIPRKTTVLSDSKPHKVTIRLLQLEAKFTYTIIPPLSTHAYLKASIKNTSENYPLLAGNINVFMDGNFVTTSTLKAVSPQEKFALHLGTDDAIKVTYPPAVSFKDTQGLLKKTSMKTMKHKITIKNTKATDVRVVVFDQFPKSTDDKIKIKLLKPAIEEGNTETLVTEAHNLCWKRNIPHAEEIHLPFEYQVEWPASMSIDL